MRLLPAGNNCCLSHCHFLRALRTPACFPARRALLHYLFHAAHHTHHTVQLRCRAPRSGCATAALPTAARCTTRTTTLYTTTPPAHTPRATRTCSYLLLPGRCLPAATLLPCRATTCLAAGSSTWVRHGSWDVWIWICWLVCSHTTPHTTHQFFHFTFYSGCVGSWHWATSGVRFMPVFNRRSIWISYFCLKTLMHSLNGYSTST